VIALVTILQMIVRLCALGLVVLGVGFWTGHWFNLIPLHMALGLLLVLCFWITAILAAQVHAPAGMIVAAFLWGALVIALGATQARLLPGSLHWIVQTLHLLIGLGAVGFNERLARLTKWKLTSPQMTRAS
jgi:hypothetical protein